MRKISLFFPIFWSMLVLWNAYRVLTDLPQIRTQACWETVMDILWLIGGVALAICCWVIFAKGAKKNNEHDKNTQE